MAMSENNKYNNNNNNKMRELKCFNTLVLVFLVRMLETSIFLFSKPNLKSLPNFSKQQKCGKSFLPHHTSPENIYIVWIRKAGKFRSWEINLVLTNQVHFEMVNNI